MRSIQPEDENQDAAHERPGHDDFELMVTRIEKFLSRLPAQSLTDLKPSNGLCTDPNAIDRQRAIKSLSRGLAHAISGGASQDR